MNQSFDFCELQRTLNYVGGLPGYPARGYPEPEFIGDRLSQYGFDYWSDLMPHIPGDMKPEERHPRRPGVYAISTVALGVVDGLLRPVGAQHLLYIGSAKNIKSRLESSNHWLRTLEDRFSGPDVALLIHVMLTHEYQWAERSLIRTLRPVLNIQHRNG